MSVELRDRVLELDGREIHYRLERRQGRRHLAMQVEPRRGLRVLAPRRCPLREIDAFLAREHDWLRRRFEELRRWETENPPLRYETGECLPLLGEDWALEVVEEAGRRRPNLARSVSADGPGRFTLRLPAGLDPAARHEAARACVERWYRRLARRLLEARVAEWGERLGRRPSALTIRGMRSRWGSCSSTGRITFNWCIVMAPPPVIDYLVVHELCHLVHLDHSPDFWARVASLLPEHRRRRRWLKENGQSLLL